MFIEAKLLRSRDKGSSQRIEHHLPEAAAGVVGHRLLVGINQVVSTGIAKIYKQTSRQQGDGEGAASLGCIISTALRETPYTNVGV